MQVARYTALIAGIFYGISHRRTLQKRYDEREEHREQKQHDELVKKAKDAWAQHKAKFAPVQSGSSGMST